MDKKSETNSDYVKKGTALIAVTCAFVIGFLGGVALGVYKSIPASPAPMADKAPPADNRAGMAAALEEETAANPDNVGAWIQLGNLYFDRSDYDGAIGAYQKALALTPNNADVWTDMGVMYRRKEQPRKAVEAFDQAIKADPKHQTSRFNKGVVLLHDLNDMPGAIAAWEELIRVNPVATTPSGQSVDELVQQLKVAAAKKPAG